MDPLPKSNVGVGVSIDEELVRVLELALVVVGRVQPDDEHLSWGDHLLPKLDFSCRQTASVDDRATIAEHLFNRPRNRRWIGAQHSLGLGCSSKHRIVLPRRAVVVI